MGFDAPAMLNDVADGLEEIAGELKQASADLEVALNEAVDEGLAQLQSLLNRISAATAEIAAALPSKNGSSAEAPAEEAPPAPEAS